MTREEVNGLDERIKELKLQHQEAERINLKNKAGELLVDINYLEELRELRNKQEPCNDCISRKSVEELISNNNDKYGYSDRFHEFTEECMNLPPVQPKQEPILDKIRAEIQKLRGCSCSCSDGIIDDVEDILDKYIAESEGKEWEMKN